MRLVGGVIGAYIGSLFGNPGIGIGWAIGSTIGAYADQPDVPDQVGPRLDDLKQADASEGSDMPMVWGRPPLLPGFPIWAPDKVETAHEEDIGGKGASGGTSTTFTYTASFAVSFGKTGDGNPGQIVRLYANKELVYDASPDADAVTAGFVFSWYDGTQTEPDPEIEADVGIGNCPIYKGQMVLVARSWPLERFGNRRPFLEAEVVTSASTSVSTTTFEVASVSGSTGGMYYAAGTDSIWCTFTGSGAANCRVVEIEPHTKQVVRNEVLSNNGNCFIMPFSPLYQINNQTHALVYEQDTGSDDILHTYELDGWTLEQTLGLPSSLGQLHLIAETQARVFVGGNVVASSAVIYQYLKADNTFSQVSVPSGYTYVEGAGGINLGSGALYNEGTLLVALERNSDNQIIWAEYLTGVWDVTEVSAYDTTTAGLRLGPVRADDGFIYWPANFSSTPYFIKLDSSGNEVEAIDLSALGVSSAFTSGSGEPVIFYSTELRSIFFHISATAYRYNIDTGTVDSYSGTSGGSWALFHAPTQTLWSGSAAGGAGNLYANRLQIVGYTDYPIADILDDLSEMAGVTSGFRDWTAITRTVPGFAHTRQASVSSDMAPLLSYARADAVQSGWKVKAVNKGGSSVVTLVQGETMGDNRIKRTKRHNIRLPSHSQIQYASADNHLEDAMATYSWYVAPGTQPVQESLPMTLDDDEAAIYAQVKLQLSHSIDQFAFSLPPKYTRYEAGDVVTTWEGDRIQLRTVNRGYNGELQCVGQLDNARDLVADIDAPATNTSAVTIPSSSSPRLLILDTPLLRDSDVDNPGPYLASWTYGSTFPGVSFNVSADGGTYSPLTVLSTEPIVATCDTVPASVDWEDWDSTNTIRVRIKNTGTLSSSTDADILAGANAAVWGKQGRWEVVQFKTVSLVSAGVYDLSDLLRGRRGTNGYIDQHQADDWFVIVSTSTIVRHPLANSDIGNTRFYKVVKPNQLIADVVSREWTVGSNPLKPYSPIQLAAALDGNDLDITWTRRSRKGGSYGGDNSLTDGVGGPISEDSESYNVRLKDSTGTVLGTFPATTNALTIVEADINSTYGSAPPTVYLDVCQVSAVVGNGFFTDTLTFYIVTPAENIIAGLSPDRFFKLDETTGTQMTDSSGNSSHGTYTNSPTLNQAGLTTVGTSVDFASASFQYGTFTTAMADSMATWSVVLFMSPDSVTGSQTYYSVLGDTIAVYTSNAKIGVKLKLSSSGETFTVSAADVLTASASNPIALTFADESGTNWLRVYVDGTEVASRNCGSETVASGGGSGDYIGRGNAGAYVDGKIDCVAEWNGTKISTTNITDIAAASA